MDTTECSTSFAKWQALVSEARPMIVFHLRFCYVCIYIDICMSATPTATAENGKVMRVAAVAQAGCSEPPLYVRIPARLARRRLFRALPAEYQANTEVEVCERTSADDSYVEQQVPANCGEEQLLGKGRAPATQMVYLQIASIRRTITSRTLFQSVLRGCRAFTHATPSPINCALALSLSLCLAHFSLCLKCY